MYTYVSIGFYEVICSGKFREAKKHRVCINTSNVGAYSYVHISCVWFIHSYTVNDFTSILIELHVANCGMASGYLESSFGTTQPSRKSCRTIREGFVQTVNEKHVSKSHSYSYITNVHKSSITCTFNS